MSQHDTTGNDPFAEWLPAYALGALEPEEAERVAAHLATCSTCPGELAAFEAAAGAFALSLEPVAVPAGHEARFQQKLAALEPLAEPAGHRERFLDKLDAQAGSEAEPAGPRRVAVPPTPPRPVAAPARRWWQALDPRAGWAAAAALALLLLLAVLWGLDGQSRAQQVQAQATQQAAVQATRVATTTAETATLARLLANPATRTVSLTGQVGGQAVQARLLVDPTSGQAVLVVDPLPAAPGNQVYEFWLIKGQTPVAINLVARDAQGLGLLVFQVPGALSDYDVAAVTVEQGFVPAPTSQPVLAGNL